MILSFSIVHVHFIFSKLNFIMFFRLLYSANMLCLLLLYLIRFQYALLPFARFVLFSPNGSVTGCDYSHGSFCYSQVYFISSSCISFPATIILCI